MINYKGIRYLIFFLGGLGSILIFQNCGQDKAQNSQVTQASLESSLPLDGELLDYVIQDVCVDNQDNIIAGDPATCPLHRDLKIGEKLPYVRVDHSENGYGWQAVSSLPVHAPDGSLRVIHSKDFEPEVFFLGDFKYDPITKGDGFDLQETRGNLFSFIRTSDGGCLDQRFFGTNRSREDAWISFDSDILTDPHGIDYSDIYIDRLQFEIINPQANCLKHAQSINGDSAMTVWDLRESFPFQSGKNLKAIDSFHFGHRELFRKNNALERFLFTREYGFTRWEAWLPQEQCYDVHSGSEYICNPEGETEHILDGRCDKLPRIAEWGDQPWVMVDCRDSTFYHVTEKPYYPINNQMAVGDIVVPGEESHVVEVITGFYAEYLGRVPDQEGLNYWAGEVISNRQTLEQVEGHISNSPEAQSRRVELENLERESEIRSQVSSLYNVYLGREPDEEGLNYWAGEVISGRQTFEQVEGHISNSPEARSKRAELERLAREAEIINQVSSFYEKYLGREPDQEGLDYWAGEVISNRQTLEQVEGHISNSPEARSRE